MDLIQLLNKNDPFFEDIRNKNILGLIERTGYPLYQRNGQRFYGPPKDLANVKPKPGSEIFVGRIPKFVFEDELVPIFERIGPLYQVRLMMDFSGQNRGYAFVTYLDSKFADDAINCLNNFKIRNKFSICVYKSIDNCRLFVGGIPHEKTHFDIKQKLEEYVQGIIKIIMYPSNTEGENNRGYVFVEFENHRLAAMARRQLGSGMSITLWDNATPVAVDWADPLPHVDPTVMNKVTKLYVRNIKYRLTTKELQIYIGRLVPLEIISRIHKIDDYAFIHFHFRNHAEFAFKKLEGAIIDGKTIEVSWARPKCYSKTNRMNLPVSNFCSSVPPKLRRMMEMQKTKKISGSSCSSSSNSNSSSIVNNICNFTCVNMIEEPCCSTSVTNFDFLLTKDNSIVSSVLSQLGI